MVTQEEADAGWDSMSESDYAQMELDTRDEQSKEEERQVLVNNRDEEVEANAHLEGLERQRERDLIEREEMQEEARAEAFRRTQKRDVEEEEQSRSMQAQEVAYVETRRSNEVKENDYRPFWKIDNQLREASLEPHEIRREQRIPFQFGGLPIGATNLFKPVKSRKMGAPYEVNNPLAFVNAGNPARVPARASGGVSSGIDIGMLSKGTGWGVGFKFASPTLTQAQKTQAKRNQAAFEQSNKNFADNQKSAGKIKADLRKQAKIEKDVRAKEASLIATKNRLNESMLGLQSSFSKYTRPSDKFIPHIGGIPSIIPSKPIPPTQGALKGKGKQKNPPVQLTDAQRYTESLRGIVDISTAGVFSPLKKSPDLKPAPSNVPKEAKSEKAFYNNFVEEHSAWYAKHPQEASRQKQKNTVHTKKEFGTETFIPNTPPPPPQSESSPPSQKNRVRNIWDLVDDKNIDSKTKKPKPMMTDFQKALYGNVKPEGKLTKGDVEEKEKHFYAQHNKFMKEKVEPFRKAKTSEMRNDPTDSQAAQFPLIFKTIQTERSDAKETARRGEVRLFNKMSIKERNYWGNVAPEGFNVRERDAMLAHVARQKNQFGQDALWNSLSSHEKIDYYGGVQPSVITKKNLTDHRRKHSEKLTYEKNQLKLWDSLPSHEQVGYYGGVQPLSITQADLMGHRKTRAARLNIRKSEQASWDALAQEEKYYYYGGVQPDRLITTAEITERRTKTAALNKEVQKGSTALIAKRTEDAALEVQRIETKRKDATPFDMFMAWGRGDKELAGLATKNAKKMAWDQATLKKWRDDFNAGIKDRKDANAAKRSWFYGGGLKPTAPTKEHPHGQFPTTSGQPRRNPHPFKNSELISIVGNHRSGSMFGMRKPLKGKWSKRKGKVVITKAERTRARKARAKLPRSFLDDVFGGF